MSQGSSQGSGTKKSPSRIPMPTSSSSSQRKRAVSRLIDKAPSPPAPTPSHNQLSGFQRLQALAKAEVRDRNQVDKKGHGSGSTNTVPWVEKHLPKGLDDLFVHKKKIEELTHWLSLQFDPGSSHRSRICVLSGPSGSGKTASIYLTAKSLDAEIKEWTNPMSLTQFRPGLYEGFRDEVQGRSQLDTFADFLFRTSQYRSLPIKGRSVMKYRVTLVEDIPNSFYRDPKLFHEVVRNYAKIGVSPLVFVFTDTASGEHSLFKMFPKTLMTELGIQNICFNPIASTFMTKYMLDICTKESKPTDKSFVEQIAATANGDIRCAVNNLQFSLTNQKVAISKSPATFRVPPNKRSRKNPKAGGTSQFSEVQQKDDTIQLFRALGKVLYAKRDETTVSENEMELVGAMEEHRRVHPLIENPENICDRAEVSTDTFLGFLHQNYPSFYGSIYDMRFAAEFLSIGDFIVSGWKFDDSGCKSFKAREVKEQVALSVAVRGLMHSNTNRVQSSWKPLTKPLVSNLENVTRTSVESTRESLFHIRELQTSLFTEVIPFYAKLIQKKPSLQIAGKREIVEKGLFQDKSTRVVQLDEKEAIDGMNDGSEGDQEGESQGNSGESDQEQPGAKIKSTDLNANLNNDNFDEEMLIEEYDD